MEEISYNYTLSYKYQHDYPPKRVAQLLISFGGPAFLIVDY